MKKSIKWLSILLILVIILSACGNGQKIDENNEELPKETNQLSETSSVPSEEDSQGIEVDKKLLTVDVTLPEQLVGDLSNFDEKEYLAENEGIKSARVNDDGSLTLTMTKSKHKEMLEEVRKTFGAKKLITLAVDVTMENEALFHGTVQDVIKEVGKRKGEFILIIHQIDGTHSYS